jgi:TonB family protein
LGGIFVSYRRSDSQGEAGRLFDDLVKHFGEHMVFMDVAAIEAGRDFRKAIEEGVVQCGVLLVLMGPEWLHAKDEAGVRRLDDPSDFVRIETASALKRDIPVIPVLVRGAQMPRAEQLPDELKELAYRNCVELTHARWRSDINLLNEALRRVVGDASQSETSQGKVPAPQSNPKGVSESSSHLEAANSSRIDPAAIERVTRELALRIGPIAGVVVKRAAPHCGSVVELYRKVAEELDSGQEREKFLRQGALPPTPKPEFTHATTPAVNLPARPVSPPSDGGDAARGPAAATGRSRSKYFLPVGVGSVLLIFIIALGLHFRPSRGSGSSESMRPVQGKPPDTRVAKAATEKPAETSSTRTAAERGEPATRRADGGALPRAQRVSVSQGVASGLRIKMVPPVYPPLARQAHVQGEVVLDADISRDGVVEELRMVSGHPMLIPAAVDAAKQWRYKPYVLNGKPVAVSTQIIVKFTLK